MESPIFAILAMLLGFGTLSAALLLLVGTVLDCSPRELPRKLAYVPIRLRIADLRLMSRLAIDSVRFGR